MDHQPLQMFPVALSTDRERGVMRRLATTPVHPSTLLGAQLSVHLGLLASSPALTAVVARMVFDVAAPRHPGGAVMSIVAGTLASYGVGIVIAAFARRASTATALGMASFFPQLLLGGLMVPADQLPRVLARIGEFTPVGATIRALQDAWTGSGTGAEPFVVLATWTVVTVAIAASRFRWD